MLSTSPRPSKNFEVSGPFFQCFTRNKSVLVTSVGTCSHSVCDSFCNLDKELHLMSDYLPVKRH